MSRNYYDLALPDVVVSENKRYNYNYNRVETELKLSRMNLYKQHTEKHVRIPYYMLILT